MLVFLMHAPGGVDVFFGVLVVDDDILEVEVGYIEGVLEFDWTIEWIGQWVFVVDDVVEAEVVLVFSLGGVVVWHNHDEELVGLAAEVTLWQKHTVWEAIVFGFWVVFEFFTSLDGGHDVLVELQESGAVVREVHRFVGVTFDDVLAGLEGKVETVEFEEVVTVHVDVDFASVFIILGANEDLDEGFGLLVAVDIDLVVEGLVVQTVLASADLEAVFVEFLLVDGNGVGDVGVVVVEVGQ